MIINQHISINPCYNQVIINLLCVISQLPKDKLNVYHNGVFINQY